MAAFRGSMHRPAGGPPPRLGAPPGGSVRGHAQRVGASFLVGARRPCRTPDAARRMPNPEPYAACGVRQEKKTEPELEAAAEKSGSLSVNDAMARISKAVQSKKALLLSCISCPVLVFISFCILCWFLPKPGPQQQI